MKKHFFSLVLILVLSACSTPKTNDLQNSSPTPLPEILPSAVNTMETQPTLIPTDLPTTEPTVVEYPVAPSDTWTSSFNKLTGYSFQYPHNWFETPKNAGGGHLVAMIINAPPDSIIAIKGTASGFTHIQVDLEPTQLTQDYPFETYINGHLTPTTQEQILFNQTLGKTDSGYSLYRITTQGLGFTTIYFVSNGNYAASVKLFYANGEPEDQLYFSVFEGIVNSIHLPEN